MPIPIIRNSNNSRPLRRRAITPCSPRHGHSTMSRNRYNKRPYRVKCRGKFRRGTRTSISKRSALAAITWRPPYPEYRTGHFRNRRRPRLITATNKVLIRMVDLLLAIILTFIHLRLLRTSTPGINRTSDRLRITQPPCLRTCPGHRFNSSLVKYHNRRYRGHFHRCRNRSRLFSNIHNNGRNPNTAA